MDISSSGKHVFLTGSSSSGVTFLGVLSFNLPLKLLSLISLPGRAGGLKIVKENWILVGSDDKLLSYFWDGNSLAYYKEITRFGSQVGRITSAGNMVCVLGGNLKWAEILTFG